MARAKTEAGGRCHNDGALIGCQGAAVLLRGSVPLCQFCEDSSSSLKRLPVRRVRPADPLGDLRRLQQRRRRIEDELDQLVHAAYLAGHSYGEVGLVLGVSRQAVRQRHLRG
jgi:hypothetical protein